MARYRVELLYSSFDFCAHTPIDPRYRHLTFKGVLRLHTRALCLMVLGRRMSRHYGIPFMGSASRVNGLPRRLLDVNIMLVKATVSYLTRCGEDPEIGGAGHRVRGSEG